MRFVQILYKKMKKSVAPLSLKRTVQGARKCIPAGFSRLFGDLKWAVTEKFFDFLSENLLHSSEFVQMTWNGVVEYTAKNRIISTFIFYF